MWSILRGNLLWFSLLAIAGGLFTVFVCPYLRDMAHFPICFFVLGVLVVLFFYGCHHRNDGQRKGTTGGKVDRRS
jgi:hypothetical protein